MNGKRSNLYYVNNDIENSKDYVNTSIDSYTDGILPYKSELVCPILPIIDIQKNALLCGFICVDCNKKNVFDTTRYDVPMMTGIADGIYDILENYNKKEDAQS